VFHPFGAAPTVRQVRWEEERCVVETEGGEEVCEWAWLEKVNL
jgi:hypothetical protein